MKVILGKIFFSVISNIKFQEKNDDDEDLQASLAVRVSFRTDTFRKLALRPSWGGS